MYRIEQFQSRFLDALAVALPEVAAERWPALRTAIEADTAALAAAHRSMAVDAQAERHLAMTSLVLASYSALEGADRERLLQALSLALRTPYQAEIKAGARAALDGAG